MTDAVLTHFKQQISSLELIPSGGGRFEVQVDGDLIYSKLETGEFPREDDIIKALQKQLA